VLPSASVIDAAAEPAGARLAAWAGGAVPNAAATAVAHATTAADHLVLLVRLKSMPRSSARGVREE
jgi:hypothetical protein